MVGRQQAVRRIAGLISNGPGTISGLQASIEVSKLAIRSRIWDEIRSWWATGAPP
jgi:hypothetical protein